MFTVAQTAAVVARLEQFHTMITLDEAVEILTGKAPSLSRRGRKTIVNIWSDISLAAGALFRKAIDAIDGPEMYSVDGLEPYLQRCRKVGFIGQLGMEVPYYDFEDGEIRLISADLVAALKGEPPLEFLDCLHEQQFGSAGRFPQNGFYIRSVLADAALPALGDAQVQRLIGSLTCLAS